MSQDTLHRLEGFGRLGIRHFNPDLLLLHSCQTLPQVTTTLTGIRIASGGAAAIDGVCAPRSGCFLWFPVKAKDFRPGYSTQRGEREREGDGEWEKRSRDRHKMLAETNLGEERVSFDDLCQLCLGLRAQVRSLVVATPPSSALLLLTCVLLVCITDVQQETW